MEGKYPLIGSRMTHEAIALWTKLTRDAQEEIFTVKTDNGKPYRWRVIALDDFNGNTGEWGLDAKQGSTSALDGLK